MKIDRQSARDGQQNHLADLADLADLATSQAVAQTDNIHVCQIQLADMAELADDQPPVNDRPERRLNERRKKNGTRIFAD